MAIISRITRIYGLVNPQNSQIFYVGRTTMYLDWRLEHHIKDGHRKKSVKAQYIKKILDSGLKPTIVEIANLGSATLEEAIIAEQAWIDFYSITGKLTNTGSAFLGGHQIHKVDWPTHVIEKLGKVSDTDLAEIVGCSQKTVSRERRRRGIPCYRKFGLVVKDLPLEHLGKLSDIEISLMVGCAPEAIRKARIARGIPACPQHEITLKTLPKSVIALLGTMSDYKLAEKVGLSQAALSHFRFKLGIPAFCQHLKRKEPIPDWVIAKLGTMSDALLAKESGLGVSVIINQRRKRDIPSHADTMCYPTRFKKGSNHRCRRD